MPWEDGNNKPKRPERPRELRSPFASTLPEGLAAFQAAWRFGLLTQGISLRLQPWAGFCRPVGPGFVRGSSWRCTRQDLVKVTPPSDGPRPSYQPPDEYVTELPCQSTWASPGASRTTGVIASLRKGI